MLTIENSQVKTLRELSHDPDNSRYLVQCAHPGYDLDGFAQAVKNFSCTADAIVDSSLSDNCEYLNVIEFKSGKITSRNIKLKALESISVYANLRGITNYEVLNENKRFLLVYNSNSKRNRQLKARETIKILRDDVLLTKIYRYIGYCSEIEFDENPDYYLK
ncbi:hypothetical protein [Streptococcus danieliae]|uniref:hypothetical protein n=1 Tax=Streptococcus danieliae TaxID=747656 RepID=UPI0021C7C2A0|nr:hypothetical protein [Streptococcus danieliae]MCU0081858.1 hypothetical protein [Streptococcus danieliae]